MRRESSPAFCRLTRCTVPKGAFAQLRGRPWVRFALGTTRTIAKRCDMREMATILQCKVETPISSIGRTGRWRFRLVEEKRALALPANGKRVTSQYRQRVRVVRAAQHSRKSRSGDRVCESRVALFVPLAGSASARFFLSN